MRPTAIIGILLIVGGLVVLLMGGFSFTRDEKVLDVGPFEATVEKRRPRTGCRRRAAVRGTQAADVADGHGATASDS